LDNNEEAGFLDDKERSLWRNTLEAKTLGVSAWWNKHARWWKRSENLLKGCENLGTGSGEAGISFVARHQP